MDLCRTGGCCPVAFVFKDKVEIREGAVHLVTLTKEQWDNISMEMRKRK